MNTMKWFILPVLAVFILVGSAACSNRRANESPRQTRSVQGRWPGPEPRDLGGMVFKIADANDDRFFPSAAEIGTPVGDAKQAAMESIMNDFNITFEIIRVAQNDIYDRVSTAVWAGDTFAHMIISTTWAFGPMIAAGLLGDLSAIPTLNLDSDLWVQPLHRISAVRGEVLATAGIFDHWVRVWAVFFNKRIYNELNLPDPYELVRRGEWTWDRLQEFAIIGAQDLNGDGVIDGINDRWGLTANPDDLLRTWYASVGGRFVDFDPVTGRLYSPAATPDGIAIADWMYNFSILPGVYFRQTGMTAAAQIDMFINGNILFYPQELLLPPRIRAMEDDIGVLPFPKRNLDQPTYLSGVSHNALLIGTTRTNNQLEETGIIMEAMAARFAHVRELQMAELEDIILRSDEDVEMLDYILPYPVYNIALLLGRIRAFNIPLAELSLYVTHNAITDFASAMEANRNAMEIEINEFFFGN